MNIYYAIAFISYFAFFLLLSISFYSRSRSSSSFILGNHSTSYWVAALSAQASDMSDWLFMAYPGLIYGCGIFNLWVAIGLVAFMYLNWTFIAPALRHATEKYNIETLASFFEKRFNDRSGLLRLMTVFFTLYFICFYVAAELIGLGRLFESTFQVPYSAGILISLILVIANIVLGGFNGMAWSGFIRGIFLLITIVAVPWYALGALNIAPSDSYFLLPTLHNLIPDYSLNTLCAIFTLAAGWGLGYFGSPHILVNFMGIKEKEKIQAAKHIGISWQIIVLGGATLAGILGQTMFAHLANRELVFVKMVETLFHPLATGFVLCAILSATMSVMTAQILTTASLVSEDCIKRFFPSLNRQGTSLWIVRACIIGIPAIAYVISYFSSSTINDLISYAWSGLGLAFSPTVVAALYFTQTSRVAVIIAMLFGGILGMIWPFLNQPYLPLLPGFLISCILILIGSLISYTKEKIA